MVFKLRPQQCRQAQIEQFNTNGDIIVTVLLNKQLKQQVLYMYMYPSDATKSDMMTQYECRTHMSIGWICFLIVVSSNLSHA